jgi:hypothetical protein
MVRHYVSECDYAAEAGVAYAASAGVNLSGPVTVTDICQNVCPRLRICRTALACSALWYGSLVAAAGKASGGP